MSTVFSKSFERNETLEIGVEFERTDVSRLDCLINGCTTAYLKVAGATPEARLLFIIIWIFGPIVSQISLKRREGTTSVGQPEGFI